jgi:hypothetical protein
MSLNVKSRFQMLRNEKLNELPDTDTYLADEKSIEGYYCVKVSFGMTPKRCLLLQ